jgi:hypothetical protein
MDLAQGGRCIYRELGIRSLKTEIPDQTTAPALDPSNRGTPPDPLAPPRQQFSKESAILIALAVAGSALKVPLGIWFKPLFHSELGYPFLLIGCQIALVCMVPFALRLNSELGLPGAPFIAAKVARQRPPGRLRSLIRIALLYDLASIGADTVALAGLKLSGVIGSSVAKPGAPLGSPLSFRSNPFAPFAAHAGRYAAMGAMAAIGAGLSEEIMFRLSLFAISTWLFRGLLPGVTKRPSRTVLWCATIMQGYAFGLAHVILRPAIFPKIKAPILIAGLMVPQTWDGIILGRLYLRRGLEASMIAHAMIDLALFLLVAVLMYLIGLLSSMPQSGVSI